MPINGYSGFKWRKHSLQFGSEIAGTIRCHHHAAQFLAMAGRHLIEQQPDDSNTNMFYDPAIDIVFGNLLGKGLRLSFRLKDLTIGVTDERGACLSGIEIEGKTKRQVFEELKKEISFRGIPAEGLMPEMHYEIEGYDFNDNETFSLPGKEFTEEVIRYRHNAQLLLEEISGRFEKAEPVRIWPHHFDTGSWIPVKLSGNGEVEATVGLGWAIPDAMITEPYFYFSVWQKESSSLFEGLSAPGAGEWLTGNWNGAILRNSTITGYSSGPDQHKIADEFFNSALEMILPVLGYTK